MGSVVFFYGNVAQVGGDNGETKQYFIERKWSDFKNEACSSKETFSLLESGPRNGAPSDLGGKTLEMSGTFKYIDEMADEDMVIIFAPPTEGSSELSVNGKGETRVHAPPRIRHVNQLSCAAQPSPSRFQALTNS